jgi:thiamine transport system ATP-binding protein
MSLVLDRLLLVQGGFRLTADLKVEAGAHLALMGPSGGGKSTLLAAIAGFVAPVAGRVLWQGRDLGPLAPAARPVAILFQDNNLFPHLDAARNVALGLRPTLRPTRAELAEAEAALARVGLGGMGGRRPAELSGGQQSRVALARTLLARRPLVLLDEPFAALGPAQRAEMLALARDRLAGATLLVATHDPADARALDGVVLVAEGRAEGPAPVAILDRPPPALAAYLGRGAGPGGEPGIAWSQHLRGPARGPG